MEKISLIIPCFNEEETVIKMHKALKEVAGGLQDYQFEFIFVNDGSSDNTLKILRELAETDERLFYLSFSRNFGKEAAIYCGLCHATGDMTAIMDADMQDPPSLIPEMVGYLQDGYDMVATRRVSRKGEPPIRSLCAKIFYKLMNRITDIDMIDGARDFRLMKRKVVEVIVKMGEYNRFSKGIFGWIGFKTKWLEYENIERIAGKTKWNFWGLLKYSIDGIINFSYIPLSLASWGGILFTVFSFIIIILVIVRRLVFGDPVQGWASLVCIIMLIGGLQLFSIGILGQYLAKTYLETKKRPLYVLDETNRNSQPEMLHNISS